MVSTLRVKKNAIRRQDGISLVELMIAMTISLFMLIGLTSLLVTNSVTRSEMEKAGKKIENGRYAIDLMADDVRHAGFYGEFGDKTSMPMPVSVPADPCSITLNDVKSSLFFFMQGYDAVTTGPSTACNALITNLKTDGTPKSDILVMRHADSVSVATSAVTTSGVYGFYLQATPSDWILGKVTDGAATVVGSPASPTGFTLTKKDGTVQTLRLFQTNIYYISTCSECGTDSIPTLRRLEISGNSFKDVPLVEGIESLQIEYGLDDGDTDDDGVVDTPSAVGDGAPDHYRSAASITTPAAWGSVVSVRIYLLARNTEATTGWDDSQNFYCLGAGSTCPSSIKFTPASGDRYKRHIYSVVVRLNNPSGRKES